MTSSPSLERHLHADDDRFLADIQMTEAADQTHAVKLSGLFLEAADQQHGAVGPQESSCPPAPSCLPASSCLPRFSRVPPAPFACSPGCRHCLEAGFAHLAGGPGHDKKAGRCLTIVQCNRGRWQSPRRTAVVLRLFRGTARRRVFVSFEPEDRRRDLSARVGCDLASRQGCAATGSWQVSRGEHREGTRPECRDPASVIGAPAVDVDRLAGDEPAVVADEEQAGGGDSSTFP